MKFIPKSVSRNVGMKMLAAKRNSPHIFFVGGVVGVVGSTVLACRATLKLEETLDEVHQDIEAVKDSSHRSKEVDDSYTEGDYHKDLIYVYGKSFIKFGRLYGPAVAVGATSIAALTGSHIQLTRRNTALTATLAAVTKAYEDYRVRIQEELGEERELEIYQNTRDQEIKNEDGKKEVVKVTDPNKFSPYARMFEESNVNWQKDVELNRIFLTCHQNYFNHKLHARGYVFLNEVYDALGFEWTKAGQVVGWVMDGEGDNFIDFGIFETRSSEFVNGYERCIVLDFNVDGVVYDKF